jgi:DNA-binding transcriptional regulator YdaS (Cro superfamily)
VAHLAVDAAVRCHADDEGDLDPVSPLAMKRPAQSSEQAAMLQLLVRRRVAAGVNQTALAARLGITQSEVSKFERGERALDPRRLRAWLHALEVEWTPLARALDRASGREDACVE